jgi:hypothetical protein
MDGIAGLDHQAITKKEAIDKSAQNSRISEVEDIANGRARARQEPEETEDGADFTSRPVSDSDVIEM